MSTRHLEHTLKYELKPSEVAEAMISTVKATGRLDSVQRETGTITGLIGHKLLGILSVWDTPIFIHIAGTENGTEATIKLSRTVDLALDDGVVQKRMSHFLGLLAANNKLKGKSVGGGW